MKKYKLNDILIPTVSFFLIMGLLIYSFAMISNISANFDKASQYTNNIGIYENNIAKISAVSPTEISNKVNSLNLQIPLGGNVATLVNDTFNLANQYGLVAQKVSNTKDKADSNKTQDKTTVNAVNIEDLQSGDLENIPEGLLINGLVYPVNLAMTVRGPKDNILKFVENLSKQERVLNVVTNTMGRVSADSENEWNSKLNIYAYAVVENSVEASKVKKITDPLDPTLLNTPKTLNTNL